MMLPAPPATPETAKFASAAREGRFLFRRCTACAKPNWYPRAICPFCGGETRREEATGRGELYAFSTLMRADPPYTLAYVTLAEGPTMMTNIVDAAPAALAIGQPVRIVWPAAEAGTPVPFFPPVAQPTRRLRPPPTGLRQPP